MIPLGVLGSSQVAAGGPWTPASLALTAWFDAADAATITSSAGKVSQWADKSGNGYHLTQATDSLRPVTGTRTLNGLNVVDFTADILARTGLTIGSPVTVALVGALDTVASYHYFGTLNTATSSAAIGHGDAQKWTAYNGALLYGSARDLNPHVLVGVFNGAASSLRVDSASTTGNTGSGTHNGITLGSLDGGTTFGIDGFIAEYIVATGVLTGPQIDSLAGYLKTKWGTP